MCVPHSLNEEAESDFLFTINRREALDLLAIHFHHFEENTFRSAPDRTVGCLVHDERRMVCFHRGFANQFI